MDVWCFPERKTEMRMVRCMRGVSLKERQPSTELRKGAIWGSHEKVQTDMACTCELWMLGTMGVQLRWHGHVERDGDLVKPSTKLMLEGTRKKPGRTLCQLTCVCWD